MKLNEEIMFDPNAARSFDLIPDGWYQANIADAALKETKDRSGEFIEFKATITGPTHQGRSVWGRLNIRNKSQDAERIGREQLNHLLGAIGLTRIADTDELVNRQLSIKVGTEKPREGYEQRNEIRGFRPLSGAMALPKPVAVPAPVAPKPVSAPAPWAKRKEAKGETA